MTLPASGPISFNAINVELGVAGTTSANINQASYRTLAGVPSGQISLSNFYGKANEFTFTIASNQTNANLRTLAVNAGWPGTAKVIATINSGIYISSNDTGTPALTVDGSFPNGVTLVNNGFIAGMGGAGGAGGSRVSTLVNAVAGSGGGLALSVASAVTIQNNGTIGGGGGGGGGGGIGRGGTIFSRQWFGGGGGGGGQTNPAANSAGGAAGLGQNGNGTAGNPGTNAGAGTGGAGGLGGAGAGGSGGSRGVGGSVGVTSAYSSGAAGGSGGGAVSGNSNITWTAFGTRLGGIS